MGLNNSDRRLTHGLGEALERPVEHRAARLRPLVLEEEAAEGLEPGRLAAEPLLPPLQQPDRALRGTNLY